MGKSPLGIGVSLMVVIKEMGLALATEGVVTMGLVRTGLAATARQRRA